MALINPVSHDRQEYIDVDSFPNMVHSQIGSVCRRGFCIIYKFKHVVIHVYFILVSFVRQVNFPNNSPSLIKGGGGGVN